MKNNTYEFLNFRYRNKMFLKDDYGLTAVLLFNEKLEDIKIKITKYISSKFGKSDVKKITFFNPFLKKEQTLSFQDYKFNLLEFVKYAHKRGYDWSLYDKESWNEIIPQKRNKFIKTRKL